VKANRERELKLSASPLLRVPALVDDTDGIVAVEREPARLLATYLDTEDLRLVRSGVTLRHRTREGWTVKLPVASDARFLTRTELVFPGEVRRPPPEALDLVRAYARGAPLAPRARLRTVRRVVELRNRNGVQVAELADDRVSVLEGRRVGSTFRELELEVTDLVPRGLADRVVALLQQAGAGPVDPTPKLVRALGPRAAAPPDVVGAGTFGAHTPAGESLCRILARSVDRLVRHDAIVRLDVDPEGVHQMRVATRRLRSDLRAFARLFRPEWAEGLRAELGWLAELLGGVRDADVLLERLRARAAGLPEATAGAARPFLASLESDRTAALAALLEALRSDRYVALLDRLVLAARTPELVPAATGLAATALRPLARRQWRALRKAVAGLSQAPPDRELHRIRIRAKRCRYAVEAAEPVLGKGAKAFAAAAARLQDRLGELNDAVVAEARLADWSAGRRSSGAVSAAGELARGERAAARSARGRWRKAWKALAADVPPSLR
jgi:CHAD domain-containing protein